LQAALARVFDVIRDSNDPNALNPLMEAVQLIPVQLTDEQAQAALARLLHVRGTITGKDSRLGLWSAARHLSSKLTTDQAQAALSPILSTMRNTTNADALWVLAELVQELAPKLSVDQAQAALSPILSTMRNTNNADTLQALAVAIQELAQKLATDRHQAQAALGPILDAALSDQVRAATTDSKALWPLLQALQLLAPQLTPDQAQAVLGPVLEPMRDTLDMSLNALQATAATVQALPVQPTAEQMQLALGGVLDMLLMIGPNKGFSSQRVGNAIAALASKLTPDQAAAALHAVLHAMFSRGWLGVGLQNAKNVSDQMVDSLGRPEPGGALVTSVIKGSPADNAKILAGDVILSFDSKTIDQAPTLLRLIAGEQPGKEAIVTLWRHGEKKKLTVILGEDIVRISETGVSALREMANAVKALPVQLTDEQARMARDGIIKVMRGSTPKSYTHHAMAEVVEALAPKLTNQAKANMLSVAGAGLAAAGRGSVAIDWAKAYEALLPPSPANGYVGSIAEVLKYPTSAIKKRSPSEEERRRNPQEYETMVATEYLQKKISERFPDTKQLQSGNLGDLVDWVAKNYPEIDLARPPVGPDLS
jgi:hypothetical protein